MLLALQPHAQPRLSSWCFWDVLGGFPGKGRGRRAAPWVILIAEGQLAPTIPLDFLSLSTSRLPFGFLPGLSSRSGILAASPPDLSCLLTVSPGCVHCPPSSLHHSPVFVWKLP